MARAHARSSAPITLIAPLVRLATPAALPTARQRRVVWCGVGWAAGWALAGSVWAGVEGAPALPEPVVPAHVPENAAAEGTEWTDGEKRVAEAVRSQLSGLGRGRVAQAMAPSLPQRMPAGLSAAVPGAPLSAAVQPLELRMAWRPIGEAARGLAWGVGVVAPAPTVAAAGPWAAQRAAETSALPAGPGLGQQVPARAVLGVGRAFGSGLSVQMDLSSRLPGQAPGRGPAAGQAPGDAALADEAGGQWRVGLAFRDRPAGEALRQGLSLKMSLGGATVLAVKPRARRVTVQLSSQW